ncbi:MAG: hypothetical protein HQK84_12415, partial [Nitrospinae bacterium]|nr:hypothetical protein [Nitrospinota bacterium]
MPVNKFPFFAPSENSKEKPYLPIRVINPKTGRCFPATLYALIDTGADECVMPGFIAENVGHNLTNVEEKDIGGIGGSVLVYPHTTTIEVLRERKGEEPLVVHRFEKVLIDYTKHNNIPPILGERNFLSKFLSPKIGGI